MFSTEELLKLKRLFQDPEWTLVDKMLRGYIEPLMSLEQLDLSNTNESVKGEVKAKLQFYVLVDKFLKDAEVLANGKEEEKIDKRDSME